MLEHSTAQLLARYVMARKFAPYGSELIALLGTGREPTNLLAVAAWIEARYNALGQDISKVTPIVAGDFDNHLEALRWEAHSGEYSSWEAPHFLPQQPLHQEERLLISGSIVFLLQAHMDEECLAELLSILVPGRYPSPMGQVDAWIKTRKRTYTYYPSELTLPLTRQLLWEFRELVGED